MKSVPDPLNNDLLDLDPFDESDDDDKIYDEDIQGWSLPDFKCFNVRGGQEKIALWTKNASNEAAQLRTGKQWKEFVQYKDTIGFIFHEDAKNKNAKNRYSI
ncbi:hypothetical protein Tsubulata_005023 [Turnera subulata]|uniref:Uncharacterized protein n=1 Tax=Turnera subulata TaxID=218843 RepID=A0A9Q0J4J8_9ROSI|nr:hypothetical protein Tsubulata_005023 [Turnera subulata]